ncbi:ATP-dependent helicase [Corynebacterium lubricantis]|uniref:ATP-dependent helicase n=1 Tax=Corynebacterium lubricantis TaxID=541095 RepID=UPI00035DC3CA|nr:UvrD-helicase domain-containing protein [Corynebacterium lubricantis]
MADMSPKVLSGFLGQKFPPTDQQADVIGAQPGPLLVVAGAGAGKTETMASRVVWLVANGYARPEEVLGLTFTRKAAQELGRRIRDRLATLAANSDLVRRLDPTGELGEALTVIAPTVSTYDAYAADLVREYGLLVPVEPDSRLITAAELHSIARDVVMNYTGDLRGGPEVNTATSHLLDLVTEMGNGLATAERVADDAHTFIAETESLPKGPRARKDDFTKDMEKWRKAQLQRLDYLPLLDELKAELHKRGVVTFNEQMSVAARLAHDHPYVGASQRRRFRVVMLDEYQDTSHAQRVLLRSLYGQRRDEEESATNGGESRPLTVTAVGDPMQAIYGWRGATAENLQAFVHDFPPVGGEEAPKKELTTSWRNPPEVLELANAVSDDVLGSDPKNRTVARLESRPEPGTGDVRLGFFSHKDEEVAYIADELAAQFSAGDEFSAAVLVRKNKHSQPIAEALEERGVPYEIVGLSGLLDVPEVADVVAIATMLIRPEDSQAALRILAGPAVGLGLNDIVALAGRAHNLTGRAEERDSTQLDTPADPLDALRAQLEQLVQEGSDATASGEAAAGLTDAIADLGEPERYSTQGLARLRTLASKLRYLRTHSLGKPLTDIFADIISVFGIRTEVLARPSTTGTVHLDKLADEVAGFSGASLDGLLDYFELAREHEDGLAPGTVTVRTDRVQILTAHKAKGLEWDTVVVAHADAGTYAAKAETFLTQIKRLTPDSFDVFEAAGDRTEFEKLCKEFITDQRGDVAEENYRLFYVALTRSERKLLITGSSHSGTGAKAVKPYEPFEKLSQIVPEDCIIAWSTTDGDDAEKGAARAPEVGTWPQSFVDKQALEAASRVDDAQTTLPEHARGELFDLWERDTTALIEEHAALSAAELAVELPGELTASDVVAIHASPEQFARRARRPVPFKPNSYAKRGTAFHEWLEDFYGASPLLTEDELPGSDDADVDEATLAQLKASFEQSHWAKRTPRFVEHPFEIALGNSVVRGRIDAVFSVTVDGQEEWWVVDWKTGQQPIGSQMETAKIQLAVYQEAWRRIADDGKPVRAAFYYVRTDKDFAPQDLPNQKELEKLLEFSAESSKKGL